jgi:hypothetical protein
MTEYEQKWLSFLEEAKNKPEEDLNEYISDIINTAKSIASRAKGQGAPSPLSGLGRGNVSVKPEEEAGGEEAEEEEDESTTDTPAAPARAAGRSSSSRRAITSPTPIDPATDESIDTEDQPILERWQKIANTKKKVL